jgi:hypothetical protein
MGQGRESMSARTKYLPEPLPRKAAAIDVRAYAHRFTRERFAELFPMLFLVGMNRLARPRVVGTAELPACPPHVDTIELVVSALYAGETAAGTFIIGRDTRSDVVIDDRHISRSHASLRVSPDLVLLSDLGSTTGTFINGRRLHGRAGEAVLVGDRITVGTISLTLLEAGETWDRIRAA